VIRARDFEDPIDLTGMIDIVIGSRADDASAHVEALAQRGFRLWCGRHAFLREYANLKIDCPGVLLGERPYSLHTTHAHRSIDLRVGADAGRSLFNAALQSGLRPGVDVLNGEGALDRLHASHVVRLRPTRLRRTPIDDSRFIEVDVRFDQTGATQEPASVMAAGICPHQWL